jgi:exosortase
VEGVVKRFVGQVQTRAFAGPGPVDVPASALWAWSATAVLFAVLFWPPMANTAHGWWSNPDAGHGLLLAPVALFLAWRAGVKPDSVAQPLLGLLLLALAVLLRYASGIATGFFVMRMSVLLAIIALIVFARGYRQVLHWWLPLALLALSVPLPPPVLNTIALPLQMQASQMGASLLEWRDVPVMLSGNVIHLPGHQLFVTEACSGLRSLSALLAIGLLIGGLWLRSPWLRGVLFLAAVPVAMVLNGIRVFLTGFLVYFVDPSIGEGLMHYTEGWVIFMVALLIEGGLAWLLLRVDRTIPLEAMA